MWRSPVGRLRIVALCEGWSYVLLLGVAMPLKYGFDLPSAVRGVGMLHGVLFILFAAALLHAHLDRRWGVGFSILVLLSSLVPLGAFWMDKKLSNRELPTEFKKEEGRFKD